MKNNKIKNILTIFLVMIVVYSSHSQKAPKWELLDKQEGFVYDENHYTTISGGSKEDRVVKIFNSLKDENPKLLNLNNSANNSGHPKQINPINLFYCNSQILYVCADTTMYDYLDGVNLIYKYRCVLYKSTNGGNSWKTIDINSNFRKRKTTSFFMMDSLNGIITQYPDSNESYSRILITNDGWQTFSEIQNHNIIAAVYGYYNPPKLFIMDLQKYIYKSYDNGKSFVKDSSNFKLGANLKSNAFSFKIYNDSIWFFSMVDTNNKSKFLKSDNYGYNWRLLFEYQNINIPNELPSLSVFYIDYFINKNTFYTNLIDEKSKEYYPMFTSDNGVTWIKLESVYDGGGRLSTLYIYNKDKHVFVNTHVGLWYNNGDSTLKPVEIIKPDSIYKINKNIIIEWLPIIGATKYQIQCVEQDGFDFLKTPGLPIRSFEDPYFIDTIVTDTYLKLVGTKNWKIYNFRIRALNDTLVSEWVSKYCLTEETTNIFNKGYYNLISIFPNPARTTTHISLQREGNITISAVDVLGRSFPLWSGYASAGDKELDVSTLPTGSYTLLIDYGTKREAVRMIKQ